MRHFFITFFCCSCSLLPHLSCFREIFQTFSHEKRQIFKIGQISLSTQFDIISLMLMGKNTFHLFYFPLCLGKCSRKIRRRKIKTIMQEIIKEFMLYVSFSSYLMFSYHSNYSACGVKVESIKQTFTIFLPGEKRGKRISLFFPRL